jgi:hypothetical chaperone protein
MSSAIAYGIDFGTSNSSIAAAYDDGTTEVLAVERDGSSALRSLIFLHRDGNRLAGADAVRGYLTTGSSRTACSKCALVDRTPAGAFTSCRQYVPGSGCQDSRLLAQIKSDLAIDTFSATHSWAVDFSIEVLVAVVLGRLKASADRATGVDVRRVVLGMPVHFPGAEASRELQQLAEERLESAARLAGFDEVELVPEPQAAVALEEMADGIVVCTDFGGGTFDVAVVEKEGAVGHVLALGGVSVGGEAFDSRIFDLKMHAALGLDTAVRGPNGETVSLPNWMRQQFRSLAGLKRLMTDAQVAVILRGIATRDGGEFAEALNELLYGGQAYACYVAIEQAKVVLSTQPEARIVVRRPPHLDLDVTITRAEFEELIADDLALIARCVEDTLFEARVRHEDVALVTRTGGSSRIPAFSALLTERFGEERVLERDAFSTVVVGLAACAFSHWGSTVAP